VKIAAASLADDDVGQAFADGVISETLRWSALHGTSEQRSEARGHIAELLSWWIGRLHPMAEASQRICDAINDRAEQGGGK
jgi:hypothetical protein